MLLLNGRFLRRKCVTPYRATPIYNRSIPLHRAPTHLSMKCLAVGRPPGICGKPTPIGGAFNKLNSDWTARHRKYWSGRERREFCERGLPGFREAASFITPAGYSGMGCDDGLRGTRTTFLVGPVPILGVSPTFLEWYYIRYPFIYWAFQFCTMCW